MHFVLVRVMGGPVGCMFRGTRDGPKRRYDLCKKPEDPGGSADCEKADVLMVWHCLVLMAHRPEKRNTVKSGLVSGL